MRNQLQDSPEPLALNVDRSKPTFVRDRHAFDIELASASAKAEV